MTILVLQTLTENVEMQCAEETESVKLVKEAQDQQVRTIVLKSAAAVVLSVKLEEELTCSLGQGRHLTRAGPLLNDH